DLQIADVSAFGGDEQVERGRHDQLQPYDSAAIAGGGIVRRDFCSDWGDGKAAGSAGGIPSGAASGRGYFGAVCGGLWQAGAGVGVRMRAVERNGAGADLEIDQRTDGGRGADGCAQRAKSTGGEREG